MFKIVRDKVPMLFERHHGYAPEALLETYKRFGNTAIFKRDKLKEETEEFLTEVLEGHVNNAYEEASDVFEALICCLVEIDPRLEIEDVESKLLNSINVKREKYGRMSGDHIVKITEDEKRHYYNNLKGKVNDEF